MSVVGRLGVGPAVYPADGLFIVLEGGDGVGKSTQQQRLADWIAGQGHLVVRTYEPGDSLAGRRIRELLLDPATGELDPRTEALLYAADKAQHLTTVVRPALDRGEVVISDRYVDSMLAYQGDGRVLDAAELTAVARWATAGLRPHLTIVLDGDPADLVQRKPGKDRLEGAGLAFHQRARQGFLALAAADPEHYAVVPARDPIDAVTTAIRQVVAPLLDRLSAAPGRMTL